jgi:hypothetical protein
MKTFLKTLTVSISSGACLYLLYYGACFGAIWLFDISITYDQRLLIEEIGYWMFLLGSVFGGVVYLKVFPPIKS